MRHIAVGLFALYSCMGYAQTETSKNLLTATTASNNIAFNAAAGTYKYSFQTGNVTAVGVLPVYDPLQVLTLNWSFDALYNCNNSIGGYCADPNGIEDEIQAFLAVGNEAGDSDVREVFNRRDFNQEWQTFSGAEVYDFSTAYEAVSLRIDGVDRGFWAGNYGPSVRNPSVVAIYTPVNTNPIIVPDCSNPLNDPSCAGYAEAVAALQVPEEPKPPTFAEQATNVVFGDSPDDFLFLDQPDRTGKPRALKQAEPPQVYQSTEQEAEMFGALSEARPRIENARSQHPEVIYLEAVEDTTEMIESLPRVKKETENEPVKKEEKLRLAEPDEIAAEVARATRRPTEEVIARQEEVLPEPPAVEMRAEPVEVAAKTRSEPAAELVNTVVKPAVDVVGIALSLVQEQSEQSRPTAPQSQDAQTMQQTAQVVSQAGANNYWEMATQQTKIAQALVQQAQPQQTNSMASVDLAPPSQAEFEDNFNDAIATGQSVGQFLSAQPVDLSRFELDEPSIQEQQLVRKATVAIKTMTQPQVEKSIDQQLENLEDTGGFTDQSLAIFLISNNLEFEQYKDVDLSDRDQFYKNTQVYPKNAPRVDPFGVLRLGGSQTYKDLVDIQWQK
jgi:hypothetical protein